MSNSIVSFYLLLLFSFYSYYCKFIMTIPIPIWAAIFGPNCYYCNGGCKYPSPYFPLYWYWVSSWVFLILGALLFPFALYLSKHTIQQIIEITFGDRLGDVVGRIIGRRVYAFSTIYFLSCTLFWFLTALHGLIGLFVVSGGGTPITGPQQQGLTYYAILFIQGTYGNNPTFLWLVFGLWATSLEMLNYGTYMLLGQKLVHLDQKNDSIPYCLLAFFVPIRFLYLFIMRGVGGVYTLPYVYMVNYFILLIEIGLFWQAGWSLVKKMTHAYELRPANNKHALLYFCEFAIAFAAYWFLSLLRYLFCCITIASSNVTPFQCTDVAFQQTSLNLVYLWISIIQAAISFFIVTVYTLKQ